MKYDDILKNYVGEFGSYQKIQYLLVVLPTVFVSMQVVSWTFTGATVGHRCMTEKEFSARDNGTANFSAYSLDYKTFGINETLLGEKEAKKRLSKIIDKAQCQHMPTFESNYKNYSEDALKELGCDDGWVWDHSVVEYSALERWEMVCDRYFLKATIQGLYYVGQAIGSLTFGYIADRLGRKLAFILAILMQCVSGLLMAFVPYWWMFGILRLIVGFGHPGVFVISVVIGMELVGPSKRYIGSVATGMFFGLGQVLLGALAWAIRDYRYLQMTISIPYFVFLIYWFIVPESARWLMSHGRVEEATAILRRAAKANGRTLPDDWHEQLEDHAQTKSEHSEQSTIRKKYTFADIFKYPNVRRRAFVAFFCWPAVSMVYYGLGMNPSFLGGDKFVVFILAGFAEIPAVFIAGLLLNRLGRKIMAVAGYSIGGFLLIMTLAVPDDNKRTMSALVIIAKAFITMEYAVQYCYCPELFPTVVRNQAMGLCSMFARIGGVAASYISMYLVVYSKVAVVLIFSVAAFTAAGLSLLLPETSGAPMLETLEEADAFGRNVPLLSFKAPQQKPQDESQIPLSRPDDVKA